MTDNLPGGEWVTDNSLSGGGEWVTEWVTDNSLSAHACPR
jgi:hypothetical protein